MEGIAKIGGVVCLLLRVSTVVRSLEALSFNVCFVDVVQALDTNGGDFQADARVRAGHKNRRALRHPYHSYPIGMPESWARAIEVAHVAEWHWNHAGYWSLSTTRDGDDLLAWAAELETQHSWLR